MRPALTWFQWHGKTRCISAVCLVGLGRLVQRCHTNLPHDPLSRESVAETATGNNRCQMGDSNSCVELFPMFGPSPPCAAGESVHQTGNRWVPAQVFASVCLEVCLEESDLMSALGYNVSIERILS